MFSYNIFNDNTQEQLIHISELIEFGLCDMKLITSNDEMRVR